MLWNTIPGPFHLKLFKLFGNLHILIEDAVLLVAGDLLDVIVDLLCRELRYIYSRVQSLDAR